MRAHRFRHSLGNNLILPAKGEPARIEIDPPPVQDADAVAIAVAFEIERDIAVSLVALDARALAVIWEASVDIIEAECRMGGGGAESPRPRRVGVTAAAAIDDQALPPVAELKSQQP